MEEEFKTSPLKSGQNGAYDKFWIVANITVVVEAVLVEKQLEKVVLEVKH